LSLLGLRRDNTLRWGGLDLGRESSWSSWSRCDCDDGNNYSLCTWRWRWSCWRSRQCRGNWNLDLLCSWWRWTDLNACLGCLQLEIVCGAVALEDGLWLDRTLQNLAVVLRASPLQMMLALIQSMRKESNRGLRSGWKEVLGRNVLCDRQIDLEIKRERDLPWNHEGHLYLQQTDHQPHKLPELPQPAETGS